jgi:signal-transduction protein with cAMP-binding, CBS, and nucleotidyltransferase domain
VRRLPVLENGQVTGIVSLGDLSVLDDAVPELAGLGELAKVTVAA